MVWWYKLTAFSWRCYGWLAYDEKISHEEKYHPWHSFFSVIFFLSVVINHYVEGDIFLHVIFFRAIFFSIYVFIAQNWISWRWQPSLRACWLNTVRRDILSSRTVTWSKIGKPELYLYLTCKSLYWTLIQKADQNYTYIWLVNHCTELSYKRQTRTILIFDL